MWSALSFYTKFKYKISRIILSKFYINDQRVLGIWKCAEKYTN